VPTLDESGVKGFQIDASSGVLAPAHTPQAIVDRIQHDINLAVNTRQVAEKLRARAYVPVANSPEAYAMQIREEYKKWGDLIRSANIKPMSS
jgi:tripartite-type tricarboxylate transporter receptor subunit TctC